MITKSTTKSAAAKSRVQKLPKIKEAVVPAKVQKAGLGKYFEAVGRRKTAISRVRIWPAPGAARQVTINGRSLGEYWGLKELQDIAISPFQNVGNFDWKVSVKIIGGGPHSQAEAVRHGISRALVKANFGFKKILKAAGLLTRDPRMKERKKPGLKGARRAPQWSKR